MELEITEKDREELRRIERDRRDQKELCRIERDQTEPKPSPKRRLSNAEVERIASNMLNFPTNIGCQY